jgi:hypothetical protein
LSKRTELIRKMILLFKRRMLSSRYNLKAACVAADRGSEESERADAAFDNESRATRSETDCDLPALILDYESRCGLLFLMRRKSIE